MHRRKYEAGARAVQHVSVGVHKVPAEIEQRYALKKNRR